MTKCVLRLTELMKVLISTRTNLNEVMIAEECELTSNPEEADFIIAQSTIEYPQYLSKTIYVAVEPPLSDHRMWCYSNVDKMHTVIRHNADELKDNQFFFTESDEAQFYPTRPDPSVIHQYLRDDITIGDRGIFYAGAIGGYEHVPNSFGGINLTKVRRVLGEHFMKNEASKIMGIGWGTQVKKCDNWRMQKSSDIVESDCDFVLALENTMLPNYLYEKIWDGFASDRVTLYLGDPLVENHIPLNCFVDLRPFFNKDTGKIDTEGIQKLIDEMTQEEYADILFNARMFRSTAYGRHQELQDKLTTFIIGRINGKD
jgi:hypothetical protein